MSHSFASYPSDKGLVTRIYRELKKLNSPKINEPINKWASELNKTFSKDSHHKKHHKQQMLARMWRKRSHHTLLVGMQTSTTTLEKNCKLLKNLNIDLPYDPEIPLLGI
jgi:hypothetical protein